MTDKIDGLELASAFWRGVKIELLKQRRSLREFSRACGCSVSGIHRCVSGRGGSSMALAMDAAQELRMSVDSLIAIGMENRKPAGAGTPTSRGKEAMDSISHANAACKREF